MPASPSPSPLRALLWPVYAPSFVYAAGASALLPAQVLLALELGFSQAQVALLATWIGGFAVVSSLSAGYVVQWLGEQRALLLVTCTGVAGLLATAVTGWWRTPGAAVVLVVALSLADLTDAVWSIARQGLVADRVRADQRGRAMNAYGASQRLGRVVGPLLAAAVLTRSGPAAVFVVAPVVLVAALVMILRLVSRVPVADDPHAPGPPPPRRAVRGLLLLGVGVLVLSALRSAKETLLPLWAAQGVHLPDTQVALVMGLTAAMELVLFWPAGQALDRIGRMPVVVACLALMGCGLVLVPLGSSAAWFTLAAVVVGLGDGIGAGIIKTLGADLAPADGRGRFLGWWQSIASVGSLVAPAVASLMIATLSLAAVMPTLGVLGLAGAAWMAWWTPRFVPSPHRVDRSSQGPVA